MYYKKMFESLSEICVYRLSIDRTKSTLFNLFWKDLEKRYLIIDEYFHNPNGAEKRNLFAWRPIAIKTSALMP